MSLLCLHFRLLAMVLVDKHYVEALADDLFAGHYYATSSREGGDPERSRRSHGSSRARAIANDAHQLQLR